MAVISENCRGRPEDMAMEVLREWLAGKGVEVSWDSLIATLRDCGLSLMADQIQMALDDLLNFFSLLRQEEMEQSKLLPPTEPEISLPRSGFSCPQN